MSAGELPPPLEREIQHQILARLHLRPDVDAWRQNTGAQLHKERQGRRRRFIRYSIKGSADISGIVRVGPLGVRLEIEVKRPGNRATKEQRAFGARVEAAGGWWFVARSDQEVIAELDRRIGLAEGAIEAWKNERRSRRS